MATLKELYTALKSLRDLDLPIDEKLIKAADSLEEKIIKEEILPSLSQNIEPLLSEIQRDLVLVVEYHPGEPISVALSRKAKISEITDAKQLTPSVSSPVSCEEPAPSAYLGEPTRKVTNRTKGLRVTFLDGTSFCEKSAIETLIAVLRHIGFERVAKLNIEHCGYNLVSRKMRTPEPGRIWQHECDGWYIYSNTSNQAKMDDLSRIAGELNINMVIAER